MARVSLNNIKKVFAGGITAVDNASIEIADGEFMVIVGPSGCGKTTTLRIIAGLENPTTGQIRIDDTIVNDLPPRDRDLAMVFQNHPLYPHMTVYENMAFALAARKVPPDEIKKRLAAAAETLHLKDVLNRKPHSLSGGQAQRTALARAIVRKPKAFLFDEPLSNLDPALRLTARTELKALHQRLCTTSIYVTHDQAEAMTLGDRICVIDNGKIQQLDHPLAIYEKPVNRFVAGFFGATPMNFFAGSVTFKNDKPHFLTEHLSIPLPTRMATHLENYKETEMVLGIRPEHLSPSQIHNQTQNTVECTVTVVEPLGRHTDICLQTTTGKTFIASVDPHLDIRPAQNLTIHINTDKVHIFEPGRTGKRITSG